MEALRQKEEEKVRTRLAAEQAKTDAKDAAAKVEAAKKEAEEKEAARRRQQRRPRKPKLRPSNECVIHPQQPQEASSIHRCSTLLYNLRGLAQHEAAAHSSCGSSNFFGAYATHADSQHSPAPAATQPSSQPGKKACRRGKGRSTRKKNAAKKYDDENPAVAIEAAGLQAMENPKGTSIFQLNPTSVTGAIEAMMKAFPDDVFHFQETKKDKSDTAALLKRLRFSGFQCSAAPSTIKHEGLSAGVLTAIRKTANAQLPCGKRKTASPQTLDASGHASAWKDGARRFSWRTFIANAARGQGHQPRLPAGNC